MGLMGQSVHPMDPPKTSSFEEYENEPTSNMAPSQRIADRHYQNPSDSPRGSDLAAATALGPGTMSARAAAATDHANGGQYPAQDGRAPTAATEEPQAWTQAKSERRLVFADESGGVLAEITYSSRTHYSKQAGTSTLPAGRACCVIS